MSQVRSIPFERSLSPLVDKSDRQHRKKYHHRPEAKPSQLAEGDCPRKQERDLKVENDEKNGDEIEAHVELHARIIECVKAALVSRQLFRVRLLVRDDKRRDQQGEP